jgi:hypothetical protein
MLGAPVSTSEPTFKNGQRVVLPTTSGYGAIGGLPANELMIGTVQGTFWVGAHEVTIVHPTGTAHGPGTPWRTALLVAAD